MSRVMFIACSPLLIIASVGYNPITNMYRAGDKGQALKNEDVAAKVDVAGSLCSEIAG